jgi:nicotinamide mononucleotide transporter
MSWGEALAAICGLASVLFIIQRRLLGYPLGLLSCALYADIFRDARLYAEALLQLYYIVMLVYGWWHWRSHLGADGHALLERLTAPQRVAGLAFIALLALLLGGTLEHFTDAVLPYWDAGVFALSITAQLLQSRRKMECWSLWAAANMLAIGLYAARDLNITTMLYGLYLLLGLFGWYRWARDLPDQVEAT